MKPAAPPLDVTAEELEALLEGVREALGEAGYQKLQAAIRTLSYVTQLLENREATLETLRRRLCQSSTEKTEQVLKQAGIEVSAEHRQTSGERTPARGMAGHGRNGAQADRGAHRIDVPHPSLHQGDRCPECQRGKVYPLHDPGRLVRIEGQAPIAATVYELEKLRLTGIRPAEWVPTAWEQTEPCGAKSGCTIGLRLPPGRGRSRSPTMPDEHRRKGSNRFDEKAPQFDPLTARVACGECSRAPSCHSGARRARWHTTENAPPGDPG